MDVQDPTKRKSFAWLNATQFLGALNDNMFKLLLIYFLIDVYGEEETLKVSAMAMAVFVTPFLIFATVAGYMADYFSKNQVIVGVKALEVAVMALGMVGFILGNQWLLLGVLFMMAFQSAIFGPSKYGVIPELVQRDQLSKANSYIEAITYLAIILGTAGGPFITELFDHDHAKASRICVVIAALGLVSSLLIAHTPAAGARKKLSLFFVGDVYRTLRELKTDTYLLLAVCASAYFLLVGSSVQINIIPYGIEVLGLDKIKSGYILLLASVGIGVGALTAGKLSGRNIEFGIVPIGAFGLGLACLALAVGPGIVWLALFLIFVIGFSAGLFVVPLKAFIQYRCPRVRLGEVLAASAFLSWLAALLAAVALTYAASALGASARSVFAGIGILTCILGVLTLFVVPDFFLRFIGFLIRKTFYRLRVVGMEHIPVEGPALLVSNHVSYADPLIIGALRPRRVRFIMNRQMYEASPLFRRFLDIVGVIPLSFEDSPKQIVAALKKAREELDKGFLVCIFAEGALTRSGLPREFKPGMERIVKDSDIPIIPIYLGGLWGSFTSYFSGEPLSHWPRKVPYPVTAVIGGAMPPTSTAAEVRQAVMELSCDCFEDLKSQREPAFSSFLGTAREQWSRPAVNDSTGKRLSYGELATASLALAGKIKAVTGDEERIGVLLPATVAGSLVNLSIAALGRVSVNLNFTASAEAFASSIDQAGLKQIITSRAFLEKLEGVNLPVDAVYVEDLVNSLSTMDKARSFVQARWWPTRWVGGGAKLDGDSTLTIIFSSGSTGEPKGVELSHGNILSNIDALQIVFRVREGDNLCCVLPFFHVFGYTGTIWFPLLSGFTASYHPNPIDGSGVAEVIRTQKSTLLITTPTFLLSYIRKAKTEDFASLKRVVVGAEKLKPRLADAFEERFGIRPLEGYGATELSPVGALNIPDITAGGVFQVGAKEGSVGHPLPGVAMRIVDPDTLEPLPLGEAGLLLVKGPNVMKGYLNHPEKTAEVVKEGWYHTGDIARMDSDGFVTITDRLSRFSKIGGEMVPHLAVEDALLYALDTSDRVLAVTSIPDEKKGERLVVLYTPEAGSLDVLKDISAKADLPNLWKPSPNSFFEVKELPLLGSGKLDLGGLRTIAKEKTESPG